MKLVALLLLFWTVWIHESKDGKFYWNAKQNTEEGDLVKVVDSPLNYDSEEEAIAGWEAYATRKQIENYSIRQIKPKE